MGTIWRTSRLAGLFGVGLGTLLLCSCATPAPSHLPLPAEVSFNPGAGRWDGLMINVHLADGEKLLFAVDTGLATTIFDKSLEPKLGKRLMTGLIWYGYFGPRSAGVYETPPLYLGTTPLSMGRVVNTDDLQFLSPPTPGHRLAGVLGMDCLKHYCLQLDFKANKMRFLEPDQLATNNLGRAYRLTSFFGEVSAHADFFGDKNASVKLDTGDFTDGVLKTSLFRRQLRSQIQPGSTNGLNGYAGQFNGLTLFPHGTFSDENYTQLAIHECPLGMWLGHQNLLGLRFLARHLVTLDFPQHTMYLRRESAGPLPDDLFDFIAALGSAKGQPARDAYKPFKAYVKQQPGGELWLGAGDFLETLRRRGQLPGWSKNDHGYMGFDMDTLFAIRQEIMQAGYPAIRTLAIHQDHDPSTYHYTLNRASRDGVWKLQRAWRADASGKLMEEYRLP